MGPVAKTLVAVAAAASIGFGTWHFTVPEAWRWFSYIDPAATELVVAVRALNALFSLTLVLSGVVNLLLALSRRPDAFSLAVVIGATCVLWLARVALQALWPQGSAYPWLQYGMLAAFVAVLACNAAGLWSAVRAAA